VKGQVPDLRPCSRSTLPPATCCRWLPALVVVEHPSTPPRRPEVLLDLISPPWVVKRIRADDLGSSENLGIERPHKLAQLSCRPLGEGMHDLFEVIAKVARMVTAPRYPTPGRSEGVGDPLQWAVSQSCPVPEGFSRVAWPEASAFELADVSLTRPGEPVDRRIRMAEVVPAKADGEVLPHGGRAPTRHCPFGCQSW
jgi:hypothetical protein